MKKTISILLVVIMSISMLAFAGCGKNDSNNNETVKIESAISFYNKVWAEFGDDNKFAAVGGDVENSTSDAPGAYSLSTEDNIANFKYYLHVTDELYDMLDTDIATLQHMMNLNSFSSAVAKLKDPTKASEFAEGYKTAIQNQQWMCGFPDKVVVISVGDYVVMAYGLEQNINALVAACSAVEAQSQVLVDAPAVSD